MELRMTGGALSQRSITVHSAHSWGLSLLGHGIAVWIAVFVLGDMKLVPQEEAFRWNVAMVEPSKPAPMAEPAPTPAKPTPMKPTPAPVQPAARPVEPTPAVETTPSPVVQTVQAVQRTETREVRQDVQEIRRVEQVVERTVQTLTRSVDAVAAVRPTLQAITPAPTVTAVGPVVATSSPAAVVQAAAPLVAASAPTAVVQASQPVVNAAPPPMVEAKSIETASATVREVVEPKIAAVTPAPVPAPSQPVQEAAAHPAPTVPRPAVKADYRWVGEALGDRVRQLLVYPAKARMNNVTGRVLVKVVIREDGHLHELEVVKGSGHEILDEAALEMVRRACPLKMKHALGRPQVTITLPVVYELVG
jgi:protein TonB